MANNNSLPPVELASFTPTVKAAAIYSAHLDYQPDYLLSPVFIDNDFVINIDQQTLVRFSCRNASLIWQKTLTDSITGRIFAAKGTIFVITDKHKINAIDANNGDILWSKYNKGASNIIACNDILVVMNGNSIQGLSLQNGDLFWNYKKENKNHIKIAAISAVLDKYILIGFANNILVCLDMQTGKRLWVAPLFGSTLRGNNDKIDSLYSVGGIVCAATKLGKLVAVKALNGTVLWICRVPAVKNVSYDKRSIYLFDKDSGIWAFIKRTGALHWQSLNFAPREISTPVISGRYLIFADKYGYICWLNKFNGKVAAQKHLLGAASILIAVYHGKQYVFATDGVLSVFKITALGDNMTNFVKK